MAAKEAAPAAERGRPYHHGNLAETILAASVAIIAESGAEALSVREAARRAGVSPGAPFRHFPSKAALMTAVAEQAMERLSTAVERAVGEAAQRGPMERFEALGQGYLAWAIDNPTHFQVISSRSMIDVAGSASLRAQNDAIRVTMHALLSEAQADGAIDPAADLDEIILSARAFGYGLARMFVDGHFPEWHRGGPAIEAMQSAMRAYVRSLTRTR